MSIVKSNSEIELIRESAQLVSKTLGMLAVEIKPGITTLELDKKAEEYIRDNNAEPGFLGLYGFPNTLCISPNNEVVHGIPNKKILKEGEIISIDCGVLKNGFYGDHAYTFSVGEISEEKKKLLDITKKSLYKGISLFSSGNRVKPSAHFEHNVAIIDGKPKLLSTFKFIYDALGIHTDEEKPFL